MSELEDRVAYMVDAFQRRDLTALQRGRTIDTLITVAGNSRLAGRYEGVGQVSALYAKLISMTDPKGFDARVVRVDDEGAELELTFAIKGIDGLEPAYFADRIVLGPEGRIAASHLRARDDQAALDRLIGLHFERKSG